jgi:hypothetical protein
MKQQKKAVYIEIIIPTVVYTDETDDDTAIAYVENTYHKRHLNQLELELFTRDNSSALIVGDNYRVKCIEVMDHDSI